MPTGTDWDYEAPHLCVVDVRSDQIDGLGHANNAAYVGWCEHVAWLHSEGLGLSVADYQKIGRGMAISTAHYEYIAATFEGDTLELATWLTGSDNRLRMERRFQFRRVADGTTVFRGCWQLICLNLASGKPARIPRDFIEVYGPAVINPQYTG